MKVTYTIAFVLSTLFSAMVFGQNSPVTGIQFSNDEINISTDFMDCVSTKNGTAKQYLNITIENKKPYAVAVSFRKNLWYNGTCINCETQSDENLVELRLEGGQSISSNCEADKQLKIFFKMLELKNVRQLSHFELRNVQVKKL
ncbi:MAG: hypothetical protein H6603_07000 [Flavobacteriales bacterium]|nr:hypothetical protein [Flavobacteriales bacterium]MCB9191867.1 hypothetical protein [Flavobacteriales bacterium]MCB9204712.1 hypothetical protein [Flavobacteriales bacterium]